MKAPKVSKNLPVFQKAGDGPALTNADMDAADASNVTALKKVLSLSALGLGAGASIRSLMGFRDLLTRPRYERRKVPNPAVIEIGVANKSAEVEEPAPSLHFPENSSLPTYPKPSWLDWFAGRTHINETAKPWMLPASILLPSLGVYAGYKGIDRVSEKLKEKDRNDELEAVKEDYRKALMEQYAANSKSSEAQSELNKDLTELAGIVKAASFNDYAGIGTGAYLTLATLLAGLTGKATYDWAKSQSPDERLARAVQTRERLRWATRPPEIYAVAKPLDEKKKKSPFNSPSSVDVNNVAKIASLYKP